MDTYTVLVTSLIRATGATVPSTVTLLATSATNATLIAAQMVAGRLNDLGMVTSSRVVL